MSLTDEQLDAIERRLAQSEDCGPVTHLLYSDIPDLLAALRAARAKRDELREKAVESIGYLNGYVAQGVENERRLKAERDAALAEAAGARTTAAGLLEENTRLTARIGELEEVERAGRAYVADLYWNLDTPHGYDVARAALAPAGD